MLLQATMSITATCLAPSALTAFVALSAVSTILFSATSSNRRYAILFGELANVGTNAAICNAIYHATGQRIRKLPVRLENIEV